ncbi:hypothetical protein FQN54_009445 [Arachnomyces sp. PD_36]|nr:hypothetical protein FQN54_009445 [Arachnomyces sp. PD_36]
MQKRPILRDICLFCASRLGGPTSTHRSRSWAPTRQFRNSASSSKPPAAAVAVEQDDNGASTQQPQPKPSFGGGFGSGWAKPSFAAPQRLTPEEEKQRQGILAQQAKNKPKPETSAPSAQPPKTNMFTIHRGIGNGIKQRQTQNHNGGNLKHSGERSSKNSRRGPSRDWVCPACSRRCAEYWKVCKCGTAQPSSRISDLNASENISSKRGDTWGLPPRNAAQPSSRISNLNASESISSKREDTWGLPPRNASSHNSSMGGAIRSAVTPVNQREQGPKRPIPGGFVPFRKSVNDATLAETANDNTPKFPSYKPQNTAETASEVAAGPEQPSKPNEAVDGQVENFDMTSELSKRYARLEVFDADDDAVPTKHNKKQSAKRQGRKASAPERDNRFYDDEFDDESPRSKKKRDKKNNKPAGPTPIYLPEFISVRNLAEVLAVEIKTFVELLEDMGFEDTKNTDILDAETAGLIVTEFNYEPVFSKFEDDITAAPPPEDKSVLPTRPPVVTIMGHVDHGKTTILDWLRKSSVAASEHGGITQHIGAFSVPMPSGKLITFLDTPGHAAFLDMRRRGADVTDIVILVVAADDSVKPQTIEAIKHAKGAKVPIIVAINKVDKDNADPEKVKQDLARNSVDVEDFGGDVQAVCVSGKTGQGMLELEEAAVTLSELLDHRAEVDGNVEGFVIEATASNSGRVATVLVKRGTLRPGDIVVAGPTWAKIRTLRNEAGVIVDEAKPGTPVQVDGWREQPAAGSEVLQASSEQRAKDAVAVRLEKIETKKLSQDMEAINEARNAESDRRRKEVEASKKKGDPAAEVDSTSESTDSGPKGVPFFIKADVSGSTEAVVNSVSALGNNEIFPNIVRSGVGPISEFDVQHAAIAKGHIISFNQTIDPALIRTAEMEGVKIMDHNIIYELIDDVKDKLSEYLPPIVTQRVTGEAEISEIFNISMKGKATATIAGCRVQNGLIARNQKTRVLRGSETVYDGSLTSLKNVKKDVAEMRKGTECGLGFEGWSDFLPGDRVQCYEEMREKRRF